MDLLRFFTAGNVDDGKSTLIGRLLYDSESISTDIIETLTRQSKTTGDNTTIDLALLTDGLRAEREQGITIDVAYKYFSTDKRKFIIADTPGHAQYTRNMFTGASTAQLAIVLVDARNGITDQTKRHSIISATLGIPKVLLCINKMDLVAYSEDRFNEIVSEYQAFAELIGLKQVDFIPTSALAGDNVVYRSEKLSWYKGLPLLEYLETVEMDDGNLKEKSRFQVQIVIRPQTEALHDYRGYAGSVLSGHFQVGDEVTILPSGAQTRISKIESNLKEVETAVKNQPVVLHLEDNLDISRGNTIVPRNELPQTEKSLHATICWMDSFAFNSGQKFLLQQNSFRTKAMIKEIHSKIDIHSFQDLGSDGSLHLNELAKVSIKTADGVSFDLFKQLPKTGAFILINENTNQTVAAGVI
ncbi:sulfate adenylyltransferase subunit 1 [Fluviicola taffensis]|uniref:sulfate adenylyltransferase n=1 Tax=Fluviicola taffensis (strain DSM 16823 / NCIMB 13979 / RW262) TaxID=755732 RepID=F2IHS6_FLUTR|nr:GTP-binding protein [Fluviicola taffensis]AEA45885.1 sulfate adenylyltransferase subunit 1 [Fluviicola taffensis DSM 16823]